MRMWRLKTKPAARLPEAPKQAAQNAAASKPRAQAGHLYRLSRLAVIRNLSLLGIIALGAVLVVLAVMFDWGGRGYLAGSAAADDNPEGALTWNNQNDFAQQYTGEYSPLSHPEMYVEIPFKYSCGHDGVFQPKDAGWVGEKAPKIALDELMHSPCPKCRELIQYAKDKEKLKNTKASPGR